MPRIRKCVRVGKAIFNTNRERVTKIEKFTLRFFVRIEQKIFIAAF